MLTLPNPRGPGLPGRPRPEPQGRSQEGAKDSQQEEVWQSTHRTSSGSPFSSTSRTSPSASATPTTASSTSTSCWSACSRRARCSSRRPTPTGAATRTTSARFHEAAIELIEVPQKSVGGKNSADIRLVVDAMDMSFQKEHINCFVVALGRLRLLAARLQAQGEQQVRHRPRGQELDLRPADRELRRVHLLRGPRARCSSARCPRSRQRCPRSCRRASRCWWTRSWRCSARTRKCSGARWSRRP